MSSTIVTVQEKRAPQPGKASAPARLLMCPPTAYGLRYVINPWMSLANTPDPVIARRQWDSLHATLTDEIGADVQLVPQAPDCPDMVFTANAGLVRGPYALLANFRFPERQPEEAHFRHGSSSHGHRVSACPRSDVDSRARGMRYSRANTLIAGYLKRSDICAHRWLSDTLTTPVLSVQLTDDRWYHLDIAYFHWTVGRSSGTPAPSTSMLGGSCRPISRRSR